MGVGKIVNEKWLNSHPSEKDSHWLEIDNSPVEKVKFKKSKEVALEPLARTMKREGYKSYISQDEFRSQRHKTTKSRTSKDGSGITQSGIQIYRHWFQFLKLALELEEMGVTRLVTRQYRTQPKAFNPESGAREDYDRAGKMYQRRDTVPFKIRKDKYEGWDLDEVLRNSFNKWWDTHSYLFEGYATSFIDNTNLDPDFLYIRIDKRTNLSDVRHFVTAQVKPKLVGKPRFEVNGYPRPDVIQNRYNALVMTYQGISNREICEGDKIYLRATDTRNRDMTKGMEGRLKVSKNKNKFLYSTTVSKQRNGGLYHLQDVMKGKFGEVPTKGIK